MCLYILEFVPKFHHCSYYLGWCTDGTFNRRFGQHIAGSGAKIIKRALEAGIAVYPVLIVAGTRADEARYKTWENNGRVLKHLEKEREKGNV